MKFVERIREGEPIPWTHRVAWYNWLCRYRVCWPLGLHLIARVVRWCWVQSFRWRRDAWDREYREIEKRYGARITQLENENRFLRARLERYE